MEMQKKDGADSLTGETVVSHRACPHCANTDTHCKYSVSVIQYIFTESGFIFSRCCGLIHYICFGRLKAQTYQALGINLFE